MGRNSSPSSFRQDVPGVSPPGSPRIGNGHSMPEQALRMSVENRFSELEAARIRMRGHLEQHRVGAQALYNSELVLEEVLTNAIKYAFQDGADHRIEVEIAVSHDAVVMRFTDDGAPFDPSRPSPQARPATIQEARIGGLGLTLIRSACLQLAYAREAGKNHLSIIIANR
jgi:anti-sigma regulatory factor (Ser/Thr protein kinase)